MKRFLIFLLLGPLIGCAVVMSMLGMVFLPPHVAIPLAYLLGIGPALCAALVDWYLAPRLRFALRVVACSGAGLLASPIFIMGIMAEPGMAILLSVPGVVAAFVCSLLSGRYRRARCGEVQNPLSAEP